MNEKTHITQAIDSMPTEREMEEYTDLLEITKADFEKWETILDLGAGTAQEFSREYDKKGYGGKVVSIDPNLGIPWSKEKERYLEEEYEHRLKGRLEANQNTVAGLSQNLPFKDKSFDSVLALFSMPKWVTEREDIINSVAEIVRVLNVGGEAKIYPIHETINKEVMEEALNKVDGISFEFKLKEEVGDEKKWLLTIKKNNNVTDSIPLTE